MTRSSIANSATTLCMFKCSFCAIVRDEDTTDTRQEPTKCTNLFRIDTDTTSQYDKWTQVLSQGRPVVTWRTHPLTTLLQMNSSWKLEPLGPWAKSIEQGVTRESRHTVLPVTQAKKVKWQKWRIVVDRRYFRRQGCLCWEDLCRGPHCQEKCDCHVVSLCGWSELSQLDLAETWQITREWTKISRIWRSHLLGSWFDTHWRSNRWILDCFGWCYYKLHSIFM